MPTQPARKCRCASDTHGHKAGHCTNLITLPELSLCKPCFDKSLRELDYMAPERGKVRNKAGSNIAEHKVTLRPRGGLAIFGDTARVSFCHADNSATVLVFRW